MPGFLAFVQKQWTPLRYLPTPEEAAGGTYIVTGSNVGLGYECAKHILRLGTARRLVLAVRSPQRGHDALKRMRSEVSPPPPPNNTNDASSRSGSSNSSNSSNTEVEVWELDLASTASVEAFAARLATLDRIDALVANAGVAMARLERTAEGIETSLAVNVLGTALLVLRAVPVLRALVARGALKGAKLPRPRIAVVASEVAFQVPPDVLQGVKGNLLEELSRDGASMAMRYPLSKQLQVYFVRELASRLPVSDTNVIVNIVNPGFCHSQLTRNTGWSLLWVRLQLMKLFLARSTADGSRTLLHGAFAGPESHGKYLADCEIKDYEVPNFFANEQGARMQKRVWQDIVDALEKRGHHVQELAGKPAPK